MRNIKVFLMVFIVAAILFGFIFSAVIGVNPLAFTENINLKEITSTVVLKSKSLFTIGKGYSYGYVKEDSGVVIDSVISEEDMEQAAMDYVNGIIEDASGMTLDDMGDKLDSFLK